MGFLCGERRENDCLRVGVEEAMSFVTANVAVVAVAAAIVGDGGGVGLNAEEVIERNVCVE